MRLRSPLLCSSLACLAVSPAGCRSSPRPLFRSEADDPAAERLSHGYALLYQLMRDESDAEKIFYLKRAGRETRSIVRVISAVSREATART